MPESAREYQRFFAELKRRHVFRIMAVYGIVGFVVLQVMELAVPALLLPDWTYRLVALLLLVGFPVALVITWAFEVTPDGVRRTRSAAPGELDAIVAQPASRRWPSGVLGILGLALLVGGWWLGRQTAPGPEPADEAGAGQVPSASSPPADARLAASDAEEDPRPSIAVLRFDDMSPEGDSRYFSDGITEELLDALAKLRELRVAARSSAFALAGQGLTARQLGDTLDVDYLLEGSVRKAGDNLRITTQLIDAGNGSHLWSEQYDRKLDDVFAIQREIAEAVAAALRISLGLDAAELVQPTADLEAYDLYLAGRASVRERGAALRDAVRLFEAAIARDSTWAPAWAGLAEAQELRAYYTASWDELPSDDRPAIVLVRRHQDAAVAAANRALSLDPDMASARVALGSVYRNRRQWDASERQFVRALALDPDDAEVHQQYGDLLISTGRIVEGLAAARRAVRLEATPIRLLVLSVAQRADDRYEEALESLEQAIALDRAGELDFLVEEFYITSLALGNYDSADRHGLPDGRSTFGVTPAQHEALVAALRQQDGSLAPTELLKEPHLIGDLWQGLVSTDAALSAIERDMERHPYEILGWLWFPPLDPLSDRPRFQAALRRVNLEDAVVQRTGATGIRRRP